MMRRVLIGAALACTVVAIGLLARGHFLEQAVADGMPGTGLSGAARQPSDRASVAVRLSGRATARAQPGATASAATPGTGTTPGTAARADVQGPARPAAHAHAPASTAIAGVNVPAGPGPQTAGPLPAPAQGSGPVHVARQRGGPAQPAAEQGGAVHVADQQAGPGGLGAEQGGPVDAVPPASGSVAAATREGNPARAPSRAAPPAAPAQEPTAETVLERASAAYEAVRSLRADFVQHLTNPLLGTETTSRGTLFQRRPDRFLMRFSEPAGDVIVSDGRYFWVYYPSVDEEQVIRTPAGAGGPGGVDLQAHFLGNPLERFDATLDGREPVAGRDAYVLTLVPRTQAAYERLVVWIDTTDYLARRFEIHGVNGVVRHFELRDLELNVPLEDELFRFTPPAGARVIDRR